VRTRQLTVFQSSIIPAPQAPVAKAPGFSQGSECLDIPAPTPYSRESPALGKYQNRGDDGVQAGSQKHGRMISSAAKESKPISLERLATILGGIELIEYALVFGSARDGIVHAGSDLDVAVSLAHMDGPRLDCLLEIVGRIEEAFGVTCDLTVLNTAGPVLRHEALKGRVLFVRPGREDDFSEFYVRTCAEYEDLMVWRARQLAYRGYVCPVDEIRRACAGETPEQK
jgi:predicted nucleotidyltransferase